MSMEANITCIKEINRKKVMTLEDLKEIIKLNFNNIVKALNIGTDYNILGEGDLRIKFEIENNVTYNGKEIKFFYKSGVFKIIKSLLDSCKIDKKAALEILKNIDSYM